MKKQEHLEIADLRQGDIGPDLESVSEVRIQMTSRI